MTWAKPAPRTRGRNWKMTKRNGAGHTPTLTPEGYARLRKALGTQAEVAALLGVHQATLSKRENGTPGYPIQRESALAMMALVALRTDLDLEELRATVAP